MHFDADTTVTDSSVYARGAATVVGSGIGSTGAQTKFGTGSCAFPGVNQYLTYPDSPDWTMSGDFTVEFWLRLAAYPPPGAPVLPYRNGTLAASAGSSAFTKRAV